MERRIEKDPPPLCSLSVTLWVFWRRAVSARSDTLVSLLSGEEDLRRIEEDRPLEQRQENARGSPKEKQSTS